MRTMFAYALPFGRILNTIQGNYSGAHNQKTGRRRKSIKQN